MVASSVVTNRVQWNSMELVTIVTVANDAFGKCTTLTILIFAWTKISWALGNLWAIKMFTFMHLADAFIQSNLHCIQGTHMSSCIPCESNPWPASVASAMLYCMSYTEALFLLSNLCFWLMYSKVQMHTQDKRSKRIPALCTHNITVSVPQDCSLSSFDLNLAWHVFCRGRARGKIYV